MNSDWVMVFSTNQPYEAEIIKALLLSYDIECVLVNKQDSAYLFGEIEVYVSTIDSFQAKQLIEEHKGE